MYKRSCMVKVKMNNNYVAFSYKTGNSFIHKMPVLIKIFVIPLFSILFFYLPLYFALALISIQFALSLYLHFSFKEMFNDFKGIIYYAVILYTVNYIMNLFSLLAIISDKDYTLLYCIKQSAFNCLENTKTASMLIKLFSIIQCASIVLKTSTSLQIRDGIADIERFFCSLLKRKPEFRFTNTVSLFVCFIPMVYRNWNQCKRAWIARAGKKNIKMYLTIFPVFFSVGIKQSYNSSKAILIRS